METIQFLESELKKQVLENIKKDYHGNNYIEDIDLTYIIDAVENFNECKKNHLEERLSDFSRSKMFPDGEKRKWNL